MSDQNYMYAQRVWIKFNIEDLVEYVISVYKMKDAVQLLGVVDFMKNVHGKFNLNHLSFVMLALFS